jgi:hypothetical protein
MGILGYGNQAWCGGNAVARLMEMPSIRDEPIGHEFIFERPLTPADVDQANKSAPLATAAKANGSRMTDSLYGRHFSRAEGWQLLRAWFNQRFD